MGYQTKKALTLPESSVADTVRGWLGAQGFTIGERDLAQADGADIVAHHPAKGVWRIIVNDGGVFDDRAAASAVASFFAAAAVAEGRDASSTTVGIALPRSAAAQREMAKVGKAMNLLGVVLLWVEPEGGVAVEENRETQTGLRPEELNASNDG